MYDKTNEHFMYHFHRRMEELQNRTDKHIQYAKASLKNKNKTKTFLNTSSSSSMEQDTEVTIDKETGLLHGIGLDEFIVSKTENKIEDNSLDKNLQELVAKE